MTYGLRGGLLLCLMAALTSFAQTWSPLNLTQANAFGGDNPNSASAPYTFPMPAGNGDPGNFAVDNACAFPTTAVPYSTQTLYWAATAGDPDGYPDVPRMLDGLAVRRRPALYNVGSPEYGFAGFRFTGSFQGSAAPRKDVNGNPVTSDVGVASVFFSGNSCYAGGVEYGFFKEFGALGRVVAYLSYNSNCGAGPATYDPATETGNSTGASIYANGVVTRTNGAGRCRSVDAVDDRYRVDEVSQGWDLSQYVLPDQTFDPTKTYTYSAYFTSLDPQCPVNYMNFDVEDGDGSLIAHAQAEWDGFPGYLVVNGNGYITAGYTKVGNPTDSGSGMTVASVEVYH